MYDYYKDEWMANTNWPNKIKFGWVDIRLSFIV